jgi:hypothetical protein
MTISSRQIVVDEKMMRDFLGANYTKDEIRETTSAQSFNEVLMVQHLIELL